MLGKAQTQLNLAALVKVGREWEAEEFAEGFSASLSLITMLIKVYWLIVAEIVFLYAAHFSVLLVANYRANGLLVCSAVDTTLMHEQ